MIKMIGCFSSLQTFVVMGGYAKYVWPAFGIVIGVLCGYGFIVSRRLHFLVGEYAQQAQTTDLCGN